MVMTTKPITPSYVIKYFSEPYNNKPTPKNVLKWLRRNKKQQRKKQQTKEKQ